MNKPITNQEELWEGLNYMVGKLISENKHNEAVSTAEEALKIAEETFPGNHENLAFSAYTLARAYAAARKPQAAEVFFDRAIEMARQIFGNESIQIARIQSDFGTLHITAKRYEEARIILSQAAKILDKFGDAANGDKIDCMHNLARAYEAMEKAPLSESLYGKAAALAIQTHGQTHPKTIAVLNDFANFYKNAKRFAKAEAIFKKILEIHEETLGPEHPELESHLNNLGLICTFQGKYADAETYYIRALTVIEMANDTEHPAVIPALENLSSLYRIQQKNELAEPICRRAKVIMERTLPPGHPKLVRIADQLRTIHEAMGKFDNRFTIRDSAREKGAG